MGVLILGNMSKSYSRSIIPPDSLLNMAVGERKAGSYDKALQLDFIALNLSKGQGNDSLMAQAYNGIATDYYRIGESDKAFNYYNKALNIFLALKDSLNAADIYYKMGMVATDQNDTAYAKSCFNTALNVFIYRNHFSGLADTYNGLASLFFISYRFDSVAYYAEKSLQNYRLAGNIEAESFMLINLAALKNALGLHNEALVLVKKGIALADSFKLINQQRQGYKNLSETYAMLGQFQNAYESRLIYEQFKDSIFNSQKDEALRDAEVRYKTVEKEQQLQDQEIQILSQENEITRFRNLRNVLILILLLALISTVFFVYRFRSRKKYLSLLDVKNKQLEEINRFKDSVFAIISHDLRSPVSSLGRMGAALSMAIDSLSAEEIKKYLREIESTSESLHQMLRGLLSWSLSQQDGLSIKADHILLNDVLYSVVKDCNAQANERKIEINMILSDIFFVFANENLLHIVFRNVISNALKFSPLGDVIEISTQAEGAFMNVFVSDHGPGIPDEVAKNLFQSILPGKSANAGTGFGLYIASELMKKQGGQINVVPDRVVGACFMISIPLKPIL